MTTAPPQAPPLRRTPASLRWSVRAAALGALVLAGWLAWHSVGWGPLMAHHVTTDGGRRLDVTWISGQCDERHEVDVAETADAVTVTVRRQVSRGHFPFPLFLLSSTTTFCATVYIRLFRPGLPFSHAPSPPLPSLPPSTSLFF